MCTHENLSKNRDSYFESVYYSCRDLRRDNAVCVQLRFVFLGNANSMLP